MNRGSYKLIRDANRALLTLSRASSSSRTQVFQLSKAFCETSSTISTIRITAKLGVNSKLQRNICSSSKLLSADRTGSDGKDSNECHGQPLHRFGSSHSLSTAANRFDQDNSPTTHYQQDMPSDKHVDVYNHDPSVNLSACMQSQVPEPYGKMPTHMNMPGGVSRREDKYLQGHLTGISSQREYSTDATKKPLKVRLDEHGNPTYMSVDEILQSPCPQGIQGENCAEFKLWLSNCLEQGSHAKCEQLANEYIAGKKSLSQIFSDYDVEIRKVAQGQGNQAKVGTVNVSNHASDPASADAAASQTSAKVSRRARLKAAVRDYGSTVIVFHIAISLASLGFFYTLLASNVDIIKYVEWLNIEKLTNAVSLYYTASTFAAAYAIHKLFAPVRIAMTLTCAPLIVKFLRSKGIMKVPKPK